MTIIIPALNEEEHILKSLEAITNNGIADKEVLIVDSGSTDLEKQVC